MVASASHRNPARLRQVALGVAMMLLMSLSPVLVQFDTPLRMESGDGTGEPWVDGGQPWPQSGRTPDRVADVPMHSPDGGAGNGTPSFASELMLVG